MTTTPKNPPQRNKEHGKYILPVVVTPFEQNDKDAEGLRACLENHLPLLSRHT